VSNYTVVQDEKKYVFGWDQHLMSFFLQVHDTSLSEEKQIVTWLGSTGDSIMYEVEDIMRELSKNGLSIDEQMYAELTAKLYADKDHGD
jgi:hypothetical protein